MQRHALCFSLIIAILFLFSCDKRKEVPADNTPTIAFKLRSSWPHDTQSFTQGLVIHNGQLYESTGQEGSSWIGIVDIKTGKPDKKVALDKKYFGEGIAILNNKVYQLTWTSKVGFVYDLQTFEKLAEFEIPSKEGWGITHDNKNLILSDGTSKLTFLDTATLKPVKTVTVTDERGDVDKINELEYVNGYVMANIWETNTIIRIDPQTGKVVARMDLTPLMQNAKILNSQADVLNGIAYHPTTKLLLVTGKYWPKIYALQMLN
jgi:glutaminyl-peptide cyclotransferase